MAEVYTFRVRLCELKNVIWRDIEITSVSSVAKLGYAVLAAFDSTASHLFNIRFKGRRYEIMFDEDDFFGEPVFDPVHTKLSALKLKAGNRLSMEYDYGAGWEFEIKLLSITGMERAEGDIIRMLPAEREKALLKILPLMNWLKSLRKQIKTGLCPKSRMDIREKKQYGIIGILTWHTVICFLKMMYWEYRLHTKCMNKAEIKS